MESSTSHLSDSNQTPPAASRFLANLPSRGLFSSTIIASNPGGMQVYVCEHDTSPPADQLVKTDEQNLLIRSLTLKKQKGDAGSKDVKGVAGADKKRAAERVLDGRYSAKRANMQASSHQEGTNSHTAEDFHSLTVERLRALLKERGLLLKGKKNELIARLKRCK